MLAASLLTLLLVEAWLWTLFGHNLFQSGHGLFISIALPLLLAVALRALLVLIGFAVSGVWWRAQSQRRWSAWAGEFWWQLKLYTFVHPLFGFEFGRALARAEGGPVVVLVHGFLCNAGVWRGFAARLRQRGYRRVYAVNLDPRYRDMQASLALFETKLQRILSAEGETAAVLVGHSMGGVLVRMFRARHPQLVLAAAAIAAPHKGTRGALLIGGGGERGPPSPRTQWLQQFNAEQQLDSGLLNIWSEADNIVWPQDSAQLSGEGVDELKLNGYGHLHLLGAPAVVEAVAQLIERSMQAKPAAGPIVNQGS